MVLPLVLSDDRVRLLGARRSESCGQAVFVVSDWKLLPIPVAHPPSEV